MKALRNFLDRIAPHFEKGQKLRKLYPVYEVIDSFFYTSDEVTTGRCHVRDGLEFKRMMSVVLVALIPCVVMAMYNTGLQANLAMEKLGIAQEEAILKVTGWRGSLLGQIGVGFDSDNVLANVLHGALYFIPIYVVCMAVGVFWELLFCVVRNHDLNEGFFVTGLLFPLTLPANIPLWQVALGISFGVVVAKEIFGGTGRNFLNPALAGRAFLFFSHAKCISGNLSVWTAGRWAKPEIDGLSGATPLGAAGEKGVVGITQGIQPIEAIDWWDAFIGTIPGCMGETSTLACLIGAVILLVGGVVSWRIMLSMLVGAAGLATLFCAMPGGTDSLAELPAYWRMVVGGAESMFGVPAYWHVVLGGFAFGLVFMATDPVTAAMTRVGQCVYGVLIGVLVILVRVVNPGFPEGTMLAILFGNTFAPLIDYYVVRANIKRRALRHA